MRKERQNHEKITETIHIASSVHEPFGIMHRKQ